MRKNTIKLGLLFILSAVLLLSSCAFIFNIKDARAYSVEYVENELKEYYNLGQNFVSPTAKVILILSYRISSVNKIFTSKIWRIIDKKGKTC